MKWVAALVGLIILASGGVASAHVLKSDNGISAVLHVAPNDQPVSGEPSQLQLSFGDVHDAFTLADCDCQVAIAHHETEVIAHPAFTDSSVLSGVATYTWPKAERYDVIVSGDSHDGAFPSFRLDYDVDVAPGRGTQVQQKRALLWEAVIAVVAVLTFVVTRRAIQSR